MPVQRVPAPTLEEVEQQLAEYQKRYATSTSDLVKAEGRIPKVDEDDAMEWLYLAEVARCLKEPVIGISYSSIKNHSPLPVKSRSELALAA